MDFVALSGILFLMGLCDSSVVCARPSGLVCRRMVPCTARGWPHTARADGLFHHLACGGRCTLDRKVTSMCAPPAPGANATAAPTPATNGAGTRYEWSREKDLAPAPLIWALRRKAAQKNPLGIRSRPDARPGDPAALRGSQAAVLAALLLGVLVSLVFAFSRELLPDSLTDPALITYL
ncbi:hypothetical protein T492DRAFT_931303 [Pavlovales sp. CCMP2436]|nr:hypothetical protein T492DRAFT_931303 [Pavlovales sp. CCMP2436]